MRHLQVELASCPAAEYIAAIVLANGGKAAYFPAKALTSPCAEDDPIAEPIDPF